MVLNCDEGQFLAIRMIIVDPDKDKAEFRDWMKKTFINAMGAEFGNYGLDWIIFLEGNKDARQSYKLAARDASDNPTRVGSTAAGANADFAWITCWKGTKTGQTAKEANQAAWSDPARSFADTWYNNVTGSNRGFWNLFLDYCYPNNSRPPHGPAYDYFGKGGPGSIQHGRGAGCLVEGFEVIHIWLNQE